MTLIIKTVKLIIIRKISPIQTDSFGERTLQELYIINIHSSVAV